MATNGKRHVVLVVFFLSSLLFGPVHAALVQYWPLDDGATNPFAATAANAVPGGNMGTLVNFDFAGNTGGWVTTDLPVTHSTAALDFDPPLENTSGDAAIDEDFVDGGDIDLSIPLGSDDPAEQVTVSVWVKPRDMVNDMRLFSALQNADFSTDGGTMRFSTAGGTLPPTVNVCTISDCEYATFPGPDAVLTEDEWHHLAFVWDNDFVTLYVNGEDQGTFEGVPFTYNDGKNFGIGSKFGNTQGRRWGIGYRGVMDDVAIWDEALTLDDISKLAQGASPLTLSQTLQAGDADQDFDFDQFDLIQVQVAAKYLTGQAATWGEGDWDGAPGGTPGNPPAGDGVFDQLDIISALAPGHYLTGPYAAIQPGGRNADGQTSIVYDAVSGDVSVDAPAGAELTSINIDSAAAIFTGAPAENLGGSFDNDSDDNIFKATFGSSFGSFSFGKVAQAGLSEAFLLDDLTVVGSLAGGGDLGDVDLIYVPEPTSALLLALAIGLVCLKRAGRWS